MHICNPSIWEAEIEGLLQVLGHPGLHSEYQANQGYKAKPCLKQTPEAAFQLQHWLNMLQHLLPECATPSMYAPLFKCKPMLANGCCRSTI